MSTQDTDPDENSYTTTDKREQPPTHLARIAVRVVQPHLDASPDGDASAARQSAFVDAHGRPKRALSQTTPVEQVRDRYDIDRIELVSASGHTAQHHYLIPHVRSIPEPEVPAEQTNIDNWIPDAPDPAADWLPEQPYGNVVEATRYQELISDLADAVDATVPEAYGVEIVAVDLTPLGTQPLPTHRFIIETTHDLTAHTRTQSSLIKQIIQQLHRDHKPHVFQTIVQPQDGDTYSVTARVAVIDPVHAVVTRDELFSHIADGNQYDLSSIYRPFNLTTNFAFPVEDYHRTYESPSGELIVRSGKTRKHRVWKHTEQAREIYRGLDEYRQLLNGVSDAEHLLAKDNFGSSRITVPPVQLEQFCSIVPALYQTSPWTGARGPIDHHTYEIVSEATGTEQSVDNPVLSEQSAPDEADDPGGRYGTAGHDGELEWLLESLRELGEDARKVEQTGESLPDGVVYA